MHRIARGAEAEARIQHRPEVGARQRIGIAAHDQVGAGRKRHARRKDPPSRRGKIVGEARIREVDRVGRSVEQLHPVRDAAIRVRQRTIVREHFVQDQRASVR